jgi:lactoylglutathione lyase
MVGEIHHVAMSVRDLDRSITFYQDGLGLRKTLEMKVQGPTLHKRLRIPEGTTGKAVYFQGPTKLGQLELIQWDLPVPAQSQPKRPGDPGPFALSFQVSIEDLNTLYARLKTMGYPCYEPPETSYLDNYGPITMFICEDPDGVMVEFINLPTREQIIEYRAKQQKSTTGSIQVGGK